MLLANKIESILFIKGEPVSYGYLSKLLNSNEEEIKTEIINLKESLSNRGIVLIEKDGKVLLGTNPENSNLIELILKDELNKDIGKAGLETLSIVLYRQHITKSEIDYIRGVNSHFILRNLSIRGLVEKIVNKNDARSFIYRPSFELLQYLGISNIEELPEYNRYKEEIATFVKNNEEKEE